MSANRYVPGFASTTARSSKRAKEFGFCPSFCPPKVPGSTPSSRSGCMPRRLLWNPMVCSRLSSWLNAFVLTLAAPMNPLFPLSKRLRDYALVMIGLGNFLGLPIEWAMLVSALAMLAEFTVYGVTLCMAYRALLPKQPAPGVSAQVQERRQLLARAGIAALSLGAGAGMLGLIRGFLTGASFTSYDGTETSAHHGFTAPITPNNEHYVVTQNPVDPAPNLDVWRLEVTGLVGSPGTYTYEQLKNLPSTSRAITLECISNGPGGRLISTAIWQGVTVRTLLARHGGALTNARYVAFYSVDGYTVSLPLEEVLKVDALLAWQMNGVTLPNRHGFPLRALVPGRYGEENPKWLTRVELTDQFVGGLYADQGWYNGPLHTWNRIDRPRGSVPLGHPVEVGGIAFAGARGVQKVEVSVDGGISWHQAQLEPPLSGDAWVLWSWQWLPTLPGRYTLEARVTDGTGEVQTSRMQGTVPNGATGYHIVMVDVVSTVAQIFDKPGQKPFSPP